MIARTQCTHARAELAIVSAYTFQRRSYSRNDGYTEKPFAQWEKLTDVYTRNPFRYCCAPNPPARRYAYPSASPTFRKFDLHWPYSTQRNCRRFDVVVAAHTRTSLIISSRTPTPYINNPSTEYDRKVKRNNFTFAFDNARCRVFLDKVLWYLLILMSRSL